MIKIKKNLLLISSGIGIIVLIFYAYWNLFHSFFLQDEWLGFALFLLRDNNGGFERIFLDSIFLSGSTHVAPLAVIFLYGQFKLFALNFSQYALVSIINHILNTFLVVVLAYKLLKNKYLSSLAGLLFGLSSISSQSIVWIATSVNTLPAATFTILSLIASLQYFIKGKNLFMLLAFFLAAIATLYKETSLMLFVLLPIVWLLYGYEKKKHYKKFLFLFSGFALAYFFFRLFFYSISLPNVLENSVNPLTQANIQTYIFRMVTFPLKIIPQTIIPEQLLNGLAEKIVFLSYPQYFAFSQTEINPYVTQTVLYDMICYMIGLVIIALVFFLNRNYKKNNNNDFSKPLFLSISIITASALPFVFLQGKGGFLSIFEPRHLYIGTVGSSMLLVLLIYSLSQCVFKQKRYVAIITGIIVFFISSYHYFVVKEQIDTLVQAANKRKYILSEIKRDYPNLPQNIIVYTESDKAYYGLTKKEKILPFQSGFGQTLLVWYQMSGANFPKCMFENNYLYAIESEGYKECEGRGYGYYRMFDSLISSIKINKIDPKYVIAFSYNSSSGKLVDITDKIRRQLKSIMLPNSQLQL